MEDFEVYHPTTTSQTVGNVATLSNVALKAQPAIMDYVLNNEDFCSGNATSSSIISSASLTSTNVAQPIIQSTPPNSNIPMSTLVSSNPQRQPTTHFQTPSPSTSKRTTAITDAMFPQQHHQSTPLQSFVSPSSSSMVSASQTPFTTPTKTITSSPAFSPLGMNYMNHNNNSNKKRSSSSSSSTPATPSKTIAPLIDGVSLLSVTAFTLSFHTGIHALDSELPPKGVPMYHTVELIEDSVGVPCTRLLEGIALNATLTPRLTATGPLLGQYGWEVLYIDNTGALDLFRLCNHYAMRIRDFVPQNHSSDEATSLPGVATFVQQCMSRLRVVRCDSATRYFELLRSLPSMLRDPANRIRLIIVDGVDAFHDIDRLEGERDERREKREEDVQLNTIPLRNKHRQSRQISSNAKCCDACGDRSKVSGHSVCLEATNDGQKEGRLRCDAA
jgi:hypothetical protein